MITQRLRLSRAEMEILDEVEKGLCLMEIASTLNITYWAAHQRMTRIRAKVGLTWSRDPNELLAWMSENGWDVRPQDKRMRA